MAELRLIIADKQLSTREWCKLMLDAATELKRTVHVSFPELVIRNGEVGDIERLQGLGFTFKEVK